MVRLSRVHWGWIGGLVVVAMVGLGAHRMVHVHFVTGYMYDSIRSGHVEEVRRYLVEGADPNRLSSGGKTALGMAGERRDPELARLLLAHGANPEVADASGETPLLVCVRHRANGVAAVLLEAGADVNARDRERMTALDIAADELYEEFFQLLLDYGADCADVVGLTAPPFRFGFTLEGDAAPFMRLVEMGCGENFDPVKHPKLTEYAVFAGHREAVEYLAERGADFRGTVQYVPGRRGTMAHLAVYYGHDELLPFLMTKGVDINGVDDSGRTPLDAVLDFLDGTTLKNESARDVSDRVWRHNWNRRMKRGPLPLALSVYAIGGRSARYTEAELGALVWVWGAI